MSELKKLIEDYDLGLITDNQLVKELSNWDYLEQDSNSSPWECDAQFVEGSFDTVLQAVYTGVIPDNLYEDIYEALEAQ